MFISYRRKDQPILARHLHGLLSKRFRGQPVFTDVDNIELGQDFVDVVEERLARCCVLLVVIGDRWLTETDDDNRPRLESPRDFVRLEVEAGLRDPDVRVIPLLVDDARMPRETELPPSMAALSRRNGQVLRSQQFDADFRVLVDRLAAIVSG